MKRIFPVILMLLVTTLAHAAEHGEHEAAGLDEHTIKTILYQAINMGILIVAVIYFVKDNVRQFFHEKQKAFMAAAEKAQAARRAAEQEHMQIKVQLTKLESTADESLSRARAEAADMRNQLVAEAHALSKKIREEAEVAARLEVEKARTTLRREMIEQASQLAQESIKGKVSREDHQRLQGDFIQNIEAVQS